MKIILEGPDGAGKTTLGNRLVQLLDNMDYVHMKRFDPMDYGFLSQTMRKQNIIWDRHFLSEVVYSKFRKEKSRINPYELLQLVKISRCEDVKVLVLLPETYGVQDYEPDMIKNEHHRLVEMYTELANQHNFIVIDPRKISDDELLEILRGDK